MSFIRRPRSLPGRMGCYAALVLWFTLILSPCLCLALAAQGQISVQLGDVPGQTLRIWLLNEARERGIGISRPLTQVNNDQTCIQTEVSFVLWMGEGKATHYCECYTRQETEWILSSTSGDACSP